MRTGTSGSVSSMSPAETRSSEATSADGNRDDDGEHDLRRVAGIGGLERVDAATAVVATSALSTPSRA